MIVLSNAAAAAAAAAVAAAAGVAVWLASRPHKLTAQQYVQAFGLISHPEGGYFRETFRAGSTPMHSKGKTDATGDLMEAKQPNGRPREGGQRNVMTSIYYCLTTDSPCQWWANNMSDHVHYWHGGGSLTYHVVHPNGCYERLVLGPRADLGETMQLIVRGGSFKCAHLEHGNGEFVILGEAVAPGFDFRDFAFVRAPELKALVPAALFDKLKFFLKEKPETDFDDFYDKPTTR
ncbi:hypothetical protein AB1Y20_017608 [Prymnesium parvum]|uniref:DUF985 domain-containing protein n=1 Tax=Prymnesium parvum TaxID=97485 RepID=A0AB34JN49_PRYPA